MPPGPRIRLRSRASLGLDERPAWLSRGVVRLGLLCLLIVLIAMLRPRLDRESAAIVSAVAGGLAVAGVAVLLGVTRRLVRRFAILDPAHQLAGAAAVLLRRAGLPLLGLLFFLAWTFVYLALWAFDPQGSFTGLDPSPRFADFFYYSVSTALISPPGDIFATSRGVRAATLIEMLTGFGLLSAYLTSFLDFRGNGGEGTTAGEGDAGGGPPVGGSGPPPAERRGGPASGM
jgi:hypothetical protein